METKTWRIFLNTLFWGIALWLFGYILGFIFFALVPKDLIGWYIMPLGVAAALWVLYKKIERESLMCYVALGIVWAMIAVLFDYIFIVLLLKSPDYYKPDVYLYYFLTFTLPVIVGGFKFRKTGKAIGVILISAAALVLAAYLTLNDRANVIMQVDQALRAKYNRPAGSFTLNVITDTGTFAKGSVNYSEGSGGLWFAAKANGRWELAFDGSGIIPCTAADKYNFPSDMIPQCIDTADTNSLVQR